MDLKEKEIALSDIFRRVSRSDIASIKTVIFKIISVINDPNSSAKDLLEIFEIDPPLASKVLKVANSAYYSPIRPIGKIEEAVIRIGFDAVKELALNQKMIKLYGSRTSFCGFSRSSLWKHSVAVAHLSKMIYRKEFGERGEIIYAAGLLHEIGIIIEDQLLREHFRNILTLAEQEEISLLAAESAVFPFDHTDIGEIVATQWRFPQELTAAIGFHHHPAEAPPEYSKITSTLFVADYICQEKGIGYCDAPPDDASIFEMCLDTLRIKPYAIELIVSDLFEEMVKLGTQGLIQK